MKTHTKRSEIETTCGKYAGDLRLVREGREPTCAVCRRALGLSALPKEPVRRNSADEPRWR